MTQETAQLDRFGGWKARSYEATGAFRLQRDDRWWLVTPEGHAFISWGMNHVMPMMLTGEYNREHWGAEFGSVDPADPRFRQGFQARVESDLRELGMNTLGTHSPVEYYDPIRVPFVHNVRFADICHYMEPVEPGMRLGNREEDFWDVFAPEFEQHCDRTARELVEPVAASEYLLGYSMADCPVFTDLDAAARGNNVYGAIRDGVPTWPRRLRNLGGDAPGKAVYVETVQRLHRDDIAGFNAAYGTEFESFARLQTATGWRPAVDQNNAAELRDNHDFLLQVVDRYYATAVAAIRRYDRTHLILGNKLNGNTTVPDEIVLLAGRHMDLIFYQFYGRYAEQADTIDKYAELTGKPIFNGDSAYSVPDEYMSNPYGPHCRDQDERAAWFVEFVEQAFARPDFVGWHWCGWMDSWEARQVNKQHSGVQDPFGRMHPPIARAMTRFGRDLYAIASGAPRAD